MGYIEEVSFRECMLQTEAVFDIEVIFGGAKVSQDLEVEEPLVSRISIWHKLLIPIQLTSSSSIEVIAA